MRDISNRVVLYRKENGALIAEVPRRSEVEEHPDHYVYQGKVWHDGGWIEEYDNLTLITTMR